MMTVTFQIARNNAVKIGMISCVLGAVIANLIMVPASRACCYDSTPVEESTPIFDDAQDSNAEPSHSDAVASAVSERQSDSNVAPMQNDDAIYRMTSSSFNHHIKQLQAEGRQLEAIMAIKRKLAISPDDSEAYALLAEQMSQFDIAGQAKDIYLSSYQLDTSDRLFGQDNLSISGSTEFSLNQPSSTSQTDRLKQQIGILFRGIEMN